MNDNRPAEFSKAFRPNGSIRRLMALVILAALFMWPMEDTFAQAPPVVWARKISDNLTIYPAGFATMPCGAVDHGGNSFFVGSFALPTLDIGKQTLTNTSAGSPPAADAFVAKYTSSGDLIWIRQIGGENSEFPWACMLDASGNLIVALGTLSANISVGTNTVIGNGAYQILLLKVDFQGNLLWTRLISGSGIVVKPSLATDPTGNILLTATYTGTNVLIGTNILTKPNPSGGEDFLAKYDPTGNAIWARQVSIAPTASNAPLVAVDGQGNSYLYESFATVADFGNVAVTNSISIAKYDADGNLLWARAAAAPGGLQLTSAAGDTQGNTFVMGYGSPGLQGITLPPGQAFVAKCDSSGTVVWGNSMATSDYLSVRPATVALDSIGNCYANGSTYAPTLGFGEIILTNMSNSGSSQGHAFVAKYSSAGEVLWARLLLTPGVSSGGRGVVDSYGNVSIFGTASGTNLFDLDGIVLQTPTNSLDYYFTARISGPALNINTSGGEAVISWPTNAVGLSLESTADIPGGVWSPVTNVPAVSGQQFVVTNTISSSSRYFRLRNF